MHLNVDGYTTRMIECIFCKTQRERMAYVKVLDKGLEKYWRKPGVLFSEIMPKNKR